MISEVVMAALIDERQMVAKRDAEKDAYTEMLRQSVNTQAEQIAEYQRRDAKMHADLQFALCFASSSTEYHSAITKCLALLRDAGK